MYSLSQLIEENKIPCFIRKNIIDQSHIDSTECPSTFNNSDDSKIKVINKKKPEAEKSLFDSLDLLNEEYLESYGIEDLNNSRHETGSAFETSSSYLNIPQSNQLLMTTSSSTASSSDNDFIYLFKIIQINCALARKYESKVVQEYLNTKYGHNTSNIDVSNDNIINNSSYDLTNIKYDDYIIPSNYEGLLEVLPDYSKQVCDTLDHECDVISFASRLKQPQNYYIAKPLKLFEIISSTSSKNISTNFDNLENNYDDLIRRWVTFDVGTICLATKVLMTVYPPEKKREKTFYDKMMDNVFCRCRNRNKIKFEVAIEFKIVKNFDQLVNTIHNEHEQSTMHLFNIDYKQNERTSNNSASTDSNRDDKYYYLPIYLDPNENIDLIPIASTNCLKLNRLQNIFNLINNCESDEKNDEIALDNPIRVRIRVENSFQNKLASKILNTSNEESPFYEIYERKTLPILVGYNLRREKLVLFACDDNNKASFKYNFEIIEQKLVEMVYDKESLNKLVNIRLSSVLKDFISSFQFNIYKIELDYIPTKKALKLSSDDDGYTTSSGNKNMHWRKKNQYKTFPKSKFIKAERLLMTSQTNDAFNEIAEVESTNTDESNENIIQRTRSKSLPDSDVLNDTLVLAKSSFTNMSLIIEQDETKKS